MEITLAELKGLIGAQTDVVARGAADHGTCLAVLDRGFVYVGKCRIEGDFLRIDDAKNIRYWGTTKGLGELTEGPTAKTKTDLVGTVLVPMRALISLIPCKRGW